MAASAALPSKGVYGTPSAACACVGFVPQLYRPVLCAMCFKSIAEHFDEWSVVPDTKPPTYINRETGETMGARANEAAVAKYQAALQQKSSSAAASSRDLLKGVAHNAISELNAKLAQATEDDSVPERRGSVGRGRLAPSLVHADAAGGDTTPDSQVPPQEDAMPDAHMQAQLQDASAPPASIAGGAGEDSATKPPHQAEAGTQPPHQAEAGTQPPHQAEAAAQPPHQAEAAAQPPHQAAQPAAETVPTPTAAAGHSKAAEPQVAPPNFSMPPPQLQQGVEEYQGAAVAEPAPSALTAAAVPSPVALSDPTAAQQEATSASIPPSGAPTVAPQPQVATAVKVPSMAGTHLRRQSTQPPALPAAEAAALAWIQENTPPIPQLLSRQKGVKGGPWMQQPLGQFAQGTDTMHSPDKYTLFKLQQALAADASGTIQQGAGLVERVLKVGPHTISALSSPPLHTTKGYLQWERSVHSLKYVGVRSFSSLQQKEAVPRLRSLSGADSRSAGAAAAVATGAATLPGAAAGSDTGAADCVVLCFGPEPTGLEFLTSAGSAQDPPPVCREGVTVRSGNLRKKKKHNEGSWKAAASGMLGAVTRRRGSITKGGSDGLGFGWKDRWATLHVGEMLYFASQASQGTARELHERGAQLMGTATDESSMKAATKLLGEAAAMTQGRIVLNGTVDVLPYFPESEPPQMLGGEPVTAALSVQTAQTHHYLQLETPAQAMEWVSGVLACTHSAGRGLPMQVHILKCVSPEQAEAVAACISKAQRGLPAAAELANVRLAERLAWETAPSYDELMQLDVGHRRVQELSEAAQVAPSTALRLLHSTGGGSGIIRQASSRMHGVVGGDGQYVAAHIQWQYIDDFDDLQGPFYEAQMRSWVQQGWFKDSTMARCVTHVLGVDYSATAAAAGGRQGRTMLMAVGDLFPDGMRSAFDGSGAWISAYNLSAQYQRLVVSAMGLGLPPSRVMAGLQLMRSNTLPPDLGLLMDLMPASAGEAAPG